RPAHELIARALRHRRLDDAVAETHLLLLDVHRHRRLRRPAHLALEPLDVLLRGTQAGDAQHDAVAEEDLAEGAAYNSADAPPHEGLWRVFTRRAAPGHLAALEVDGAHVRLSLTSVTTPVIAAAATIAGLMSNVRPVGLPCRPMKFRLLDDALISRPWSLSSFMPRHMEQPALRHW